MAGDMGSKVTLSSGKVVLLREPRIEHQALAAQAISGRAGDDKFLWATLLNKEMVRLMIHSINDVRLSPKDLLDMDKHLSYRDFSELNSVVTKLTGGDDPLAPTVETVPFGDK